MSERILMPLDGSKLGEAALSYVDELISRLAPGETVEITLFHVITTVRHNISYQGGGSVSIPYTEEELAKFKDEAKAYLERVSRRLQSTKIALACKVAVNENPAEAIIEAEKEVNADLIAMATHGRSGLSRFAIGSVADKVMRGGGVPVLMVRSSED
ncbi:universal stress protein [Desulfopila inferna]|uniref:universal stress protein n=1 Tax=Desulfopila inferna TaxID=468528 RepID=UPI00196409BA|nr:universal stress protein [Desulfopila inferna]MBM9603368.1 universal stress protein [Desulfopila inferna]